MSAVGRTLERRGRAGRARRPLRRPARGPGACSSGTRCRASGSGSWSPTGTTASRSCAPTPSRSLEPSPDRVRAALPVRRARPVRRLRLAARSLAGAARAQGRGRAGAAAAGSPGSTCAVEVEAVPGDADGLGWRTRVQFAVDDDGTAGPAPAPLARGRADRPLPDRAPAGRRGRRDRPPLAAGTRRSRSRSSPSTGERLVLPRRPRAHGRASPRSRRDAVVPRHRRRVLAGAPGGGRRRWWTRCSSGLDPRPGESALDLYCGVGLFAAALAARVGPTGRVTAVETDRVAVEDARHNLRDLPAVRIERGRVDHVLRRLRLRRADLVVLDPPRSGAGRSVVDLLSPGPGPRGSPTSPATRRRWPATSRYFARARATGWPACGRSTCSR